MMQAVLASDSSADDDDADDEDAISTAAARAVCATFIPWHIFLWVPFFQCASWHSTEQ